MGSQFAQDMAETFDLTEGIGFHFALNCYPPIPQSMVPVAVQAVEAVREGDEDLGIDLPEGVTWRGQVAAPAIVIVDQHRLWDFV